MVTQLKHCCSRCLALTFLVFGRPRSRINLAAGAHSNRSGNVANLQQFVVVAHRDIRCDTDR